MKVTNTTRGDLGLPNGVLVPALGSVDIDEKVLAEMIDQPVVAAWIEEGMLDIDEKSKGKKSAPAKKPADEGEKTD